MKKNKTKPLSPRAMTSRSFKIKNFMLVLLFGAVLLSGCSGAFFSTEINKMQVKRPTPKLNVVVMPRQRVELSSCKALMIPVFMAGAQERHWGQSVTNLIRSIMLQEGIFGTLELFPTNNPADKEILKQARDRGFDYLVEVSMPPVIEPSGDSDGWVALHVKVLNVNKGYSIWRIYGETQLIPQPTCQCLFGTKAFVPAPSVGQGIVSITRQIAMVMRQQQVALF